MSDEKQTESTNSSQTATETPEQRELNQLDLQARRSNQQGLIDVQGNSLNLANLLLKGMNLPGYLKNLPGGISEEVTQDLVNQSLRDIKPGFQQGGILDSGVAASISARTAGDIRRGSAEFNNNNLLQLLNLATGNAAQVQQPVLAQSQALGGRLAGLNSYTGNSSTTKTSMNPFLKSFQTAAGTGLGGGAAGAANGFGGGILMGLGCWVAAEVFEESMFGERVSAARKYIFEEMPVWFRKAYLKYGQKVASFIHNKPILKSILKPIFSYFAKKGGYNGK